jgi:hypothetical protein
VAAVEQPADLVVECDAHGSSVRAFRRGRGVTQPAFDSLAAVAGGSR